MTKIRLNSPEQEKLVIENLALLHHIVNQYNVKGSDYKDFISIGTIGLIKAAATFEESKKVKFSSYAAKCIRNELFMYFRKQKHKCIPFDEPIIIGDKKRDTKIFLKDILSTDEDFIEKLIEDETLIKLMNFILSLNKREMLIMLYMIIGTIQNDIAKILKLSQSYIAKIEKKLTKQLKQYYTEETIYTVEEVFSIKGDFYQISLNVEIDNSLVEFLKNISEIKFNINNGRLILQMPREDKSIYWLIQIIQKIDEYQY